MHRHQQAVGRAGGVRQGLLSGGPAGYILGYHVGGRHLHYVAPEATEPGEDIGVVKRDQGVWVPACHVCRDIEVVVEAARWFFRTTEPHPEISWGGFGRTAKWPRKSIDGPSPEKIFSSFSSFQSEPVDRCLLVCAAFFAMGLQPRGCTKPLIRVEVGRPFAWTNRLQTRWPAPSKIMRSPRRLFQSTRSRS